MYPVKDYNYEDLAGFIYDHFGPQIVIEGENKTIQSKYEATTVSSEELVWYASYHLKYSNLTLENKAKLSRLIDEEKCRVHSIRNLLLNVTSDLK